MANSLRGSQKKLIATVHCRERMVLRGFSSADVRFIMDKGQCSYQRANIWLYWLPLSPFAVMSGDPRLTRLGGCAVVVDSRSGRTVTVYDQYLDTIGMPDGRLS